MLLINNVKTFNQNYKYKDNKQHFWGKIPNSIRKPSYIPNEVWDEEQAILKTTNNSTTWKNLLDSINKYIKGNYQLLPIMDYIPNKILCNNKLNTTQKIKKINETFRLYNNLLTNNPNKTVNKFNPIDMTTIVKVLISELNCDNIKFEGLKNIENGYSGPKILSTYDSLTELIKFAQSKCRNENIKIKFDKPKALFTTISYKGSAIKNEDLKKVLPNTYYYSGADEEKNHIIINSNNDITSITVKMCTFDEYI